MSEHFYNPYQFIPVDTTKAKGTVPYAQQKGGLKTTENKFARHDYWHRDGVSGRITCILTALSPLVVGGGQVRGNTDQDASTVEPYLDRDGKPTIPASSLRGMVASIAETVSQSSLRVLVQAGAGVYSLRKPASDALTLKGRVCQVGQEGAYLQPLAGGARLKINPMALQTLESIMRGLSARENNPKEQRLKRQAILRKNINSDQRGWDEKEGKALVLVGDELFYDVEAGTGEVVELSYSSIWRKAVPGDLHAAFVRSAGKDSLPWNPERDVLTPAEALFGVVEDNPDENRRGGARNLAARVRFTDAHALGEVQLEPSVPLKILNSPKPPSPAMYFGGQDGYIAKKDLDLNKHRPNGRKHYLPHPRSLQAIPTNHWQTHQTDRQHLHLICQPIPKNTQFQFTVDFENLSQQELGLLLTALQPAKEGNGSQFIHRLGLGKPIGLGHVVIRYQVETINRQPARYSVQGLREIGRYQPWGESPDRGLIDQNALAALQQMSDPRNLMDRKTRQPISTVCYPFDSKNGQEAYNEDEGFKWFGTNDRTGKNSPAQALKKIVAGQALPVLDS